MARRGMARSFTDAITNIKHTIHNEVNNLQAETNNIEIELTYSKRYQSEGKVYQCTPLGLVFKGGMPYLVASIKPNSELRQFAASRIKAIYKTSRPANPLSGFDLDKYITEGNLGITKTNQKLKFKAAHSII